MERLRQFWESIESRWQIPLLAAGVMMLAGGVLQLRPAKDATHFQQVQDDIETLRQAGLYTRAATKIDEVLAEEERTNEDRAWLHATRADTLYLLESPKQMHDDANLRGLLSSYDRAKLFGTDMTGEMHRQRADAHRWLNEPVEAVKAFREALRAGGVDPVDTLRLIVLQELDQEGVGRDRLASDLDALIEASSSRPPVLAWGLEKRLGLIIEDGNLDEAEKRLGEHEAIFRGTPNELEYDYLVAWTSFKQKQYDQAERLLRSIRSQLKVRNELDAKSGWLLGMVNLEDDRPQLAVSLFQSVLNSYPSGPYVTACKFGQAECLATLQQYERSVERYADVMEDLRKTGDQPVVRLGRIRDSLTAQAELLLKGEELALGLRFLEMAIETIPAASESLLMGYLNRLAAAHGRLAEQQRADAETLSTDGLEDARALLVSEAKAHHIAAAEAYLRVARLSVLEDAAATEAVWSAADEFDLAGEPDKTIGVLKSFLRERTSSTKIPQALFRLGQAYQATGQYEKAIEKYRLNQQRFPRTLPAIRSLVPMAMCFRALGKDRFPEAEETLLLLVDDSEIVAPEAPEFRTALWALSELYLEQGAYEKSIRRFEEYFARYPQDPQEVRGKFFLAEAYRKSAQRLAKAATEADNAVHVERMADERRGRLGRSVELFKQVAIANSQRADTLTPLEELYQEQSYLYRADGLYELDRFDEAVRAYRDVAGLYPNSPAYLAASAQLIRIHLRHGRIEEARAALGNARTRLSVIPAKAFADRGYPRGRKEWEFYLDRLAQLRPFKKNGVAEPTSTARGDGV